MSYKVFLTVGTQAPFDRLVQIIDSWVEEKNDIDVFGQIGNYRYKPKNFKFVKELNEIEFSNHFDIADLIVSHAGMGTIIKACENNKPILVLPRSKKKKEHRNDHQLKTVEGLSKAGYIFPCYIKEDLLNFLTNYNHIVALKKINKYPESSLVEYLENRIEQFFVETNF